MLSQIKSVKYYTPSSILSFSYENCRNLFMVFEGFSPGFSWQYACMAYDGLMPFRQHVIVGTYIAAPLGLNVLTNIHTRVYCDIYLHHWNVRDIFRYVLCHIMIVFFFLFSLKSGIIVLTFCRRWRYRALSLQLTVPPVMAGLSVWRSFILSALLKIFTPDFAVIYTSLKCALSSLKYSFSFLINSRESSSWWLYRIWWHRDLSLRQIASRGHRLRRGCWLEDLLSFSAWLSSFLHPILLWYLHHWNVHDIFTFCFIMPRWIHYRIAAVFSFLADSRGSSSWRLFRLWWYRELSLRQFAVSPLMAGLSASRSYIFSARLNVMSPHIVCCTSLKCTWYVVKLFYYA